MSSANRTEQINQRHPKPFWNPYLAGIGLGLYKDENDAFQQTYKEGQIFEPDPDRQKQYEDYYRIFKKMYPSLKEVNHDIFNRFKS